MRRFLGQLALFSTGFSTFGSISPKPKELQSGYLPLILLTLAMPQELCILHISSKHKPRIMNGMLYIFSISPDRLMNRPSPWFLCGNSYLDWMGETAA
jgi:hypothetical protein